MSGQYGAASSIPSLTPRTLHCVSCLRKYLRPSDWVMILKLIQKLNVHLLKKKKKNLGVIDHPWFKIQNT